MSENQSVVGGLSEAPVTSYRLLPARSTAAVVTALLAVAAAGWVYIISQVDSMSDMVTGLGQVGHLMPDTMAVTRFFAMWVAMMTAMMCPALAPVVLAHRAMLKRRNEGLASSVSFVAGYLAVWWLIGLVYLLPYLWFRGLSVDAGGSRWLPALAGAILAAAGIYQFTRRKAQCQESCSSPQAFVTGHDAGRGLGGAFRTGVDNGRHCLGCCAALMAVLLVVGLMNLLWMVLLSLVFLAEKHLRRATGLDRVVGTALIALGVVVAVWPTVLPPVSGTSDKPPPMSHMGGMDM